MHVVALLQQELCKIQTVSTGDAGDQRGAAGRHLREVTPPTRTAVRPRFRKQRCMHIQRTPGLRRTRSQILTAPYGTREATETVRRRRTQPGSHRRRASDPHSHVRRGGPGNGAVVSNPDPEGSDLARYQWRDCSNQGHDARHASGGSAPAGTNRSRTLKNATPWGRSTRTNSRM